MFSSGRFLNANNNKTDLIKLCHEKHYRDWPDFHHKTVKGPIELSSDYSCKRVKFNELSLCNFKAFASFRGENLLQEN